MNRTGRTDVGAVASVIVLLIVTDLLLIDQNMWRTVPLACLSCVLLLTIGRRAGLSWQEIGLDRATLGKGVRWGSAAAFAVAIGYLLFTVLPASEEVLSDESMPTTVGAAAIKIMLVIPLRTILLEELAFRGVLWGLLRRRGTAMSATGWCAVAFGLWHVPAGLRLIESNQALDDAVGDSRCAAAAVVFAIVIFTACAGVLFAELRRRSGSLLAPMGLHWATNGIGTLMSTIR